jgi:hypothetical protein
MTPTSTGTRDPLDVEAYAGPATLLGDDRSVDVEVTLRGMFQPIDGHFHWYGRVTTNADVDALVAASPDVTVRTPHGEAVGRLSDRDPWGRFRIAGTGKPPY